MKKYRTDYKRFLWVLFVILWIPIQLVNMIMLVVYGQYLLALLVFLCTPSLIILLWRRFSEMMNKADVHDAEIEAKEASRRLGGLGTVNIYHRLHEEPGFVVESIRKELERRGLRKG